MSCRGAFADYFRKELMLKMCLLPKGPGSPGKRRQLSQYGPNLREGVQRYERTYPGVYAMQRDLGRQAPQSSPLK